MQINLLILTSSKKQIISYLKKMSKKYKNKKVCLKAISLDENLKIKKLKIINTKTKKKENELINIIKTKKINFILSFTYKWILSKKVLASVNYNAFNIHGAKLSEYRGNHTSIIPILDNKKFTYVELHQMNDFVDSGQIIRSSKIKINDIDTGETLSNKIIRKGCILMDQFIKNLNNVNYLAKIKSLKLSNKKINSKFISKDSIIKLKKIDNIKDKQEVLLKTRAFDWKDYEPAYYKIKNKKIYLRLTK